MKNNNSKERIKYNITCYYASGRKTLKEILEESYLLYIKQLKNNKVTS